jgi:N-acetylmuramoyl-L-alanine amidase
VQDEYVGAGRVNRGVKEQGLAVLQKAGMPAILTEIGFISNAEEEKYINSEDGQAEIVNNLLQAIKNYKRDVES